MNFKSALTLAISSIICVRAFAVPANGDSPPNLPPEPAKPVPFLTGTQELSTFKIDPGFKIELVAEEPLVQHPVAMQFDPDGRLWVVEMRGYMPDAFANNEKQPIGRISILEDTDGDGKMDKSTVFLDHLVLPRAIALVNGGAIIAEPPNLYFCKDTNGDGVCDQKTVIATDYGTHGNPEHMPNGLMHTLDNWLYNANYDKRLKFDNGKWTFDDIQEIGQWGVSMDNWGRIFHDSNSDQLRANVIPDHYADRNPHYHASGINEQIAKDQTTWPAINTAVDRGYIASNRYPDGRISHFTAACAPVIYRGGIFPSEYDGNAFVCEPSGCMIKRDVLVEKDANITAKNAYTGREFMTSTYERFRPVNLYNGPDGAMYVVDMHHGLIQHDTYLTTYCRQQYLLRALDKYLLTGRIFRIVPDGAKKFDRPQMSKATTEQLVGYLSHENGWWRDTAQQLLVERNDHKSWAMLRKLATTGENPLGRLHALWALEGMHKLNSETVLAALQDKDANIRAQAIRLAELTLTPANKTQFLPAVMNLASDTEPHVRLQFALTVSGFGTPEADKALSTVLADDAENQLVRDAVISGMRSRELTFLQTLLAEPKFATQSAGHSTVVRALATCVMIDAQPKRVEQLLDLASSEKSWRQTALLDGLTEPAKHPTHKNITLDSEPKSLATLASSDDKNIKNHAKTIAKLIHWPGQPGYVPPKPPEPLTADQQKRFELGRQVYSTICIQCHKADGMGQAGLAPPLATSEWVDGPPARIARIVLAGLTGPVTVDGQRYTLEMPGVPMLSDEQLAGALTYIRRSWDHKGSPIEPSFIKQTRDELAKSPGPITEAVLLKIQPEEQVKEQRKRGENPSNPKNPKILKVSTGQP